ncbi:SsrA-binding protein [Weissella confusa]|uniref:SsrA-binding protein n=1 Tax=Weissella confusa TaxID=1583 RepID=A0A923NG63_WEICO|nr:SsrA-binding protein [Weissella confusa]
MARWPHGACGVHKKEIKALGEATAQQGKTIVPLRVYLKRGFAKVLIGVATGKHNYDKRETIKKRDQDRDLRRSLKVIIGETYEAGIELTGTEIKSVRASKITIAEGFIQIRDGQAWLDNVHISPFEQGNRFNHEPLRSRRLLSTRTPTVRDVTKNRA